jgi:hypothetical protein
MNKSSKHTKAGAVAGGVVGGIALIVGVILAAFLFGRWRSRRGDTRRSELDAYGQQAYPAETYCNITEMDTQMAQKLWNMMVSCLHKRAPSILRAISR